MKTEEILKNLSRGDRLDHSALLYLWTNSQLFDLGSHVQNFLTSSQRETAELFFELEIPLMTAAHLDYLLETYNKIHRASHNSDYRNWLNSLALNLPMNHDWRQNIHLGRLWHESHQQPALSCFSVHEIKTLAELTATPLREILNEIARAGYQEIRASKLSCDFDPRNSPDKLEKHIWFEMLHAVAEAGLKTSVMIDLAVSGEDLIRTLQLIRTVQEETAVLVRCCFYSSTPHLDPGSLEHALKVVAISRCYLSDIRCFELVSSPAVIPYLSLFSQMGMERISKTFRFTDRPLELADFRDPNLSIYRSIWSQVLADFRQFRKTGRIQLRHRFEDNHYSFVNLKQSAPLLLYKADKGDSLSEEEAIHLAYTASLYSLGQCTQSIRQQLKRFAILYRHKDHGITLSAESIHDYCDRLLELPSSRHIKAEFDFSQTKDWTDVSFQNFIEKLAAIHAKHPELSFSISGLKSFWQKAIQEQIDLQELIGELARYGLKLASSSPGETEQDLTHSEIRKIHANFHKTGIPTIAKAEIVVPYTGDEVPLWDRFCQRLGAFKNLHMSSHLLYGIGVCLAPGCKINLSEHLRAIAITRIFLKDVNQIMFYPASADIDHFSSWQEFMKSNISLLVRYGIDDFGKFDPGEPLHHDSLSAQFSREGLIIKENNDPF
ncbi:MAG: hypothetical protein ACOH5I_19145 [Oligoflexus sp.]